ncbi:MAG: hypothetical protein HYS40_05550 [Gemmatimonadetes bacterium]|nr:hypothetical protein [Gemmatimonadota bacterium]
MRRIVLPVAALLLGSGLVVAVGLAQQQQQQDRVYWYVSAYQVSFDRVDSLTRLLRAHRLPVIEERKRMGTLLDERWLIHNYGDEYNVVRIGQFRTLTALVEDTTGQAAFRKVYPDSVQRAAISAAFNWVFAGAPHRDNIYREVRR